MSLARRSITSASWNVAGSLVNAVVLFGRSVLLARLLPIETFGVYTFASSWIVLSLVPANFGMGDAFIHRAPETEHEQEAAAVHFTLKGLFILAWALLMGAGAWFFTDGATRLALLVLIVVRGINQLAQTPRLILIRRVVHRRLALLQTLDAIISTLVALTLAFAGVTLWALLATDVVTTVLSLILLFGWRPVWRPRLAWVPQSVRYFLRFGSQSFGATLLQNALDRVDDLWTGAFLGQGPLGFYSRAYTFAGYPSSILAAPLNTVAGGTYAELKGNRHRLSQAFFRTNAFLVRSGFLLGGLLWLVAPEFIRLFPGPKWMPMLDAFRLMLIYTLFDPVKGTVANLFIAVGQPEKIVRARLVQLVVLVVGLFTLGPRAGITGVALAVDGMLVVGIVLLLAQARTHADFSPLRLFASPALAVAVALPLAHGVSVLTGLTSDWLTGGLKIVAFTAIYGSVLLLLERRELLEMTSLIAKQLPRRRDEGRSTP